MSKNRQGVFESKTFGKLGAVGFYLLLAIGLFYAASNMNYSWKWNSVPKYFAYEKIETIPADFDGTVELKKKQLILTGSDGEKKVYPIVDNYQPAVDDGDDIYSGDSVLEKKHWVSGPLVNGLIVTLKISALGGLIAFFFATILAFMRISKFPILQYIASSYITVIRGTPLLVQIFIFYFIIATIFDLPRFYAGAMSLGLFYAAYIAEVLRGAIQSIDKGQHEAAKSLGMNYVQTMSAIIMPQALKRALPALVGEVIALVKDSSLVSVISITDLTKVGREIVANTFSPFETWLVVALMYFAITSILSFAGHRWEQKMKLRGGMS
ncbi:MAG TPA: ABC transporter permease subunit [Epsilonproteobacteria bacterium]|jgi:polar amino acid transport system permease protein|nr:ABC transporter permease subunit [Nitratifractor sp.]HHD79711.1 ABC transporter permease subunit [Campylobacterota bacterium]HHE06076.1 ABC transporter permease subunit [Campylobacterota bacterium]